MYIHIIGKLQLWLHVSTITYDFKCAFTVLGVSPLRKLKGKISHGVDDDDNDSNHIG